MIGFHKSHAVVIGIDAYGEGIPPLRTAVHDATEIARVLGTAYGYSVRLLTEDVSLARLQAVFGEALPHEVEGDDRVLVYFAGHGIALDGDDGPAGYLIPQDARRQDKRSFLPMTELNRSLDVLPCRHLLLVLDCCFAGAYRWSSTRDLGALPEVIHRERFDRYIKDPAWQVITSAAHDQKALDVVAGEILGSRGGSRGDAGHSPFAAAFLRALEKGEADLIPRGGLGAPAGDGVITATELYLYLRESVEVGAEADGHLQTPGLWPLKKHGKGEFIHLVPGHPLNLPPAPALDEASNPWRGLQSYDEQHAGVFFGRSRFVAALADRIRARPLTVVLGASGTGKSSVVKAGLLSHLRGTEPGAWEILPPIRPGKSPLASLAGLSLPSEPADDLDAHLADFRVDPEALARRVGAWASREPGGRRLLLIVDQFEELITLSWDAAERGDFMALLQRALAVHPGRLRVVLTLRSDFEPQFTQTPLQVEWLSSRIVVPAMTLDEYREAIEVPALVKVLYFQGKGSSQEFIDRLIGDVANTPGALPLLSFTLSELYRHYLERQGDDRSLREVDYERLGGVGGSLRNRANEVYDGLPDDGHRRTMRTVMLRMVSVEGGELTRRHVLKKELCYDEPEENRRVEEVISRLTGARLVVEGKEPDDQTYVEPAHDELIRGWDRLAEWTRDGLSTIQLRQVLSPSVRDWCADGRFDPDKLWHANPRLALLSAELGLPFNWRKYVTKLIRRRLARGFTADHPRTTWLNVDESHFVIQSLARRHRTTTIAAAVTVGVIGVLLGLTVTAFHESVRADVQRREAQFTTANLSLDRGLVLAQQGKARNGLLWMARGLALNPEGSPDLDRAIRLNLAAWASQVPISRGGLEHSVGTVKLMMLSPDGRTLATAAGEWNDESPFRAYLWDVASGERIAGPLATTGDIRALIFSRDGSTFATASGPLFMHASGVGEVRVWQARTGRQIGSPLSHPAAITALELSPDGMLLFAGSVDGLVYRHHVQSGAPAGEPFRHESAVSQLALSPDGAILLVGAAGHGSRLWDVSEGQPIGSPLPHEVTITATLFNRDGTRALTAGSDGTIQFWESRTARSLGTLVHPGDNRAHANQVSHATFGPDARTLLTCSYDGTAKLWDVATRKLQMIYNHDDIVTSASFSPDGQTIATSCYDDFVRLFDTSTGMSIGQPIELTNNVYAVTFGRDGRRLFTAGLNDRFVRAWEVPRLQAARWTMHLDTEIHDVVLCRKGGTFLVLSWENRTVWIRDVANGEVIGTPIKLDRDSALMAAEFSPDGRYVATSAVEANSKEASVRVWDATTGKPVTPLLPVNRVSTGRVYAPLFAFGPDGRTLLTSGTNGLESRIRLWEVEGASLRWEILYPGECAQVLCAPDGQTVLIADRQGDIQFLDARSGRTAGKKLRHPGAVIALTYSPDGAILASCGGGNAAQLWNVETGQPIGKPMHHSDQVNDVVFSTDGRVVATASGDHTARLWDSRTGNPLTQPLRHEGMLNRVGFCGGGKLIITSGNNLAARVWDIASGREVGPGMAYGAGRVVSAVSPDGRGILTGGQEGTIKLWDVPKPEAGDVREIGARVRGLTGMDFGERDSIEFHNAPGW